MSYISLDFDSYESKIGYKFNNCQLLKTALTHSSCANTHLESNERLEFLGDATLGILYCRFPQKTEGELSKLKGFIVSRHACKRVALQLGLDRYLRIGKGVNPIPDSLVSNVMEAVIGAIFIDGGFEAARSFVEDHFSEEIDAALNSGRIESKPSSKESDKSDEVFEDFKSLLQIETQRMFPGQKPSAWGKSKKEAEQRAAGNALRQIKGQTPLFQ